jgi:hypothetical protein
MPSRRADDGRMAGGVAWPAVDRSAPCQSLPFVLSPGHRLTCNTITPHSASPNPPRGPSDRWKDLAAILQFQFAALAEQRSEDQRDREDARREDRRFSRTTVTMIGLSLSSPASRRTRTVRGMGRPVGQ